MPADSFVDQARHFLGLTVTHAFVMFPYITLPPFVISPLLQVLGRDTARRRLLDAPDGSLWRSVWLGICSPPGRSRIFQEAQGLLAAGLSPSHVVAYLIAAHSFVVYIPLLILALSGPQPVIGLVLSALLSILLLRYLLRTIPAGDWEKARTALSIRGPAPAHTGASSRGSAVFVAFVGDLFSLWWPLLLGATLGAIVAVWGLSNTFFSIQGGNEPLVQLASAVAGLVLSYVSGVPAVGSVYPAAWLWKAEFFGYAGLMAFYLGVLVTPFALPRYADLFGRDLAWKVVRRLVVAIVVAALAVTAFWYALDWLFRVVGLAAPIESLIDSTIKPNPVPWFHTLFWRHPH